jgi:hypothetical protein
MYGTSAFSYLSHETGLTVIENNELEWLIKETVATITVPTGTGALITGHRCRIIETNEEIGRFNLFQQGSIFGTSSYQSFTVLQKTPHFLYI